MKIVSFLCVFNDWEYLDETITSFKNYPDKLFIIEGSWKSSQKFGANSRSNDLVYEIINKHVDNKKVFLIQANEERERNQRQVGLELAKQESADWCHMIDADEVYTEKSLQLIKSWLNNNRLSDNVLGYRLKSYNFINSFNRWYNGDYMRIYRVTPQAHFYMDNDVAWPDCKGTISRMPAGPSFYHYNYVRRNTERFWLMMRYQNEQDPTFWKRYIETGQYDEKGGQYKIPDDIKVYDFRGKHPAIMKDHPYFKNNIFGDGEIRYDA